MGRAGYTRSAPGEIVDGEEHPGVTIEAVPAAHARAVLLREHHRYLSVLAQDPEAEPSPEATAGGILAAETEVEIHEIHGIVRAWYQAHKA